MTGILTIGLEPMLNSTQGMGFLSDQISEGRRWKYHRDRKDTDAGSIGNIDWQVRSPKDLRAKGRNMD